MAGLSSTQKDTILDATLVAGTHMSLHSGDPGGTGASEAAGGPGPYARQAMAAAWAAAAGGTKANNAVVTFAGLPAGTWSYIGFWDAAVAGNFIWGGTVAVPRTTIAGDSLLFPVGNITATFTP